MSLKMDNTITSMPYNPGFGTPRFSGQIHFLGHFAIILHTRFIWLYMRKDVKRWCNGYVQCQQHKFSRHTRPPIMRFPTGNRFETLHLDIVGTLPMSKGKSYIITMIDRKTRWPEAVLLSNISASNVAK